jgi:hypothetical protein
MGTVYRYVPLRVYNVYKKVPERFHQFGGYTSYGGHFTVPKIAGAATGFGVLFYYPPKNLYVSGGLIQPAQMPVVTPDIVFVRVRFKRFI